MAASFVFYAWGEPIYVALLFLSCVFTWTVALMLNRMGRYKKIWLFIGCLGNLGTLIIFKYSDFIITTLNTATAGTILPILNLSFPIGVSFFTLQAISYLVDVYRGISSAQKKFTNFALYIAFFPKLFAGPIVRYHTFEKQIAERIHNWENFSYGCTRFAKGFIKKMIIANSFAVIADNVFLMTRAGHEMLEVPVTLAWIGAFAYTFQIFFDFSAYSDMAIGLGRMFGFELQENFCYPYISKSMGEFWRRWHISLGTWFREYVYIPLGGSKNISKGITIRNLCIVWILTGFWHGAAGHFLLWGIFNFSFLVIEELFSFEDTDKKGIWRHLYVMMAVVLGWVIFRCENYYHLQEFFGNLFWQNQNGFWSPYTWMFLKEYFIIWVAGVVLSMPVKERIQFEFVKKYPLLESYVYPGLLIVLFFIAMCYLSKSGYSPFIYYSF